MRSMERGVSARTAATFVFSLPLGLTPSRRRAFNNNKNESTRGCSSGRTIAWGANYKPQREKRHELD
jgi:hypothetical protein